MATMIHEILPVGVLQCNCSILGDEQTKDAIVIDPGDNIPEIEQIVNKHQLTVKAIVITHAHIDHIAGAEQLRKKTGAPVYLNRNDTELLATLALQAHWIGVETPGAVTIDTDAADGSTLRLGDSELHVLHTPGHTQGSISVYIPQHATLLAGDTLFRDSVGRTDLPGGNTRQLLSSIKTQVLTLPEETVVIPGHGPSTTIGREKLRNPFLRNI
jgi:hydroxyacylglutathione hydrolase